MRSATLNGADGIRDAFVPPPQIPSYLGKEKDGFIQNASRWIRKVEYENTSTASFRQDSFCPQSMHTWTAKRLTGQIPTPLQAFFSPTSTRPRIAT